MMKSYLLVSSTWFPPQFTMHNHHYVNTIAAAITIQPYCAIAIVIVVVAVINSITILK